MDSLHHKPIKRFSLSGIIHDEASIGRLKIEYIRLLVLEMRLGGHVPRIDIDPDFTISYNEHRESFDFKLSIHGTYIGKRKSECILGIDGTRVIYIQPSKSSESSQDQESRLNQKQILTTLYSARFIITPDHQLEKQISSRVSSFVSLASTLQTWQSQ